MFWALAGVPFTMFSFDSIVRYFGMAVCIIIGIAFLVFGIFTEQEEYKILKEEPLLFDYEYLKDLSNVYAVQKKKYITFAIPSVILFIVGLMILGVTSKGCLEWSEYHSFVFLGLAIGVFGIVNSCGIMGAYKLLIKNEKYSNSLLFKVKRKIKSI